MRREQGNLILERGYAYNVLVSLRLKVLAEAELCVSLIAVRGQLLPIVAHLVLDRTKETRLTLGSITTFVKDSKNLYQNE